MYISQCYITSLIYCMYILSMLLLVCFQGGNNNCKEFECEIIHLDRQSSTLWNIPQIPVMTLEFIFVRFKKGEEIFKGVIEKKNLPLIRPGTFLCSSHCQIQINGENTTVLWKLAPSNKSHYQSRPQLHDLNQEAEQDTTHCLPFKVLGTCYSSDRQRALQEALQYLEEYNRPVFAKLEAEPENAADQNAIAVYVMSSGDYEKVGYIAKELTQHVHPVLSDPSLNVEVKKIRFCTIYRMIGFYLTIEITKKGLWDNAVVSASKKVM